MQRLELKDKKQAIVIVAHPDDETIWMGGTILKNQKVDWTIFSLCRAGDRERAPKFKKVCAEYKANPIMGDLDDEGKLSMKASVKAARTVIEKMLDKKEWDYIFTHGANGEYGHERHKTANRAVKSCLVDEKLKPGTVFYFSYRPIGTEKAQKFIAETGTSHEQVLGRGLYKKKRLIMSLLYGFDPNGIDTNYCTNPEYFNCSPANK